MNYEIRSVVGGMLDKRETHYVWSFFMVVNDGPHVVLPFGDRAFEVNDLLVMVISSSRGARIVCPNPTGGGLRSVFERTRSLMINPRHRLFVLSTALSIGRDAGTRNKFAQVASQSKELDGAIHILGYSSAIGVHFAQPAATACFATVACLSKELDGAIHIPGYSS